MNAADRLKQAEQRASRNASAADIYKNQVTELLALCRTRNDVTAELVEAARPYLELAAPHEQLFSGEDLRNFQRLEAAFTEADKFLRGAPRSVSAAPGAAE